MKNILSSLEVIAWTTEDRANGVPAHVRECIAAEYGNLPPAEKDSRDFKSSANTKTVRFGEVSRKSWKVQLSPALQLLSLCIQVDAIASAPCNLGMVIRLDADQLPSHKPDGAGDEYTTVQDWLEGKRSRCRVTASKAAPVVAA